MIKEAVRIGMLLKTALAIAESYDNVADGGTCNLDTCVIEFENTNKTFIEIINEINGGCLSKYRKTGYMVHINCNGQGFKRTKKAQVVCDYLKSHGLKAYVEYTMD